MIKIIRLWMIFLAVVLMLADTVCAEIADDAFMDALLGDESLIRLHRIDVIGLLPTDEARVRKQLGIIRDDLLLWPKVKEGVARVRANGDFALSDPVELPALDGEAILAYRVFYRRPPLQMSFGDDGSLVIRLGPETILDGALSSVEFTPSSMPSKSSFDSATRLRSMIFSWGEVTVLFTPENDRLDVRVEVVNHTDEVLVGVMVNPFGDKGVGSKLNFIGKAVQFDTNNIPNLPAAAVVDLGVGAIALGLDGDWSGCSATLQKGVLCVALPSLSAGTSRTVRMSLRFGPSWAGGGSPYALADDHYCRYRKLYPFEGPHWSDRRPIGALHISSVELGLRAAKNDKNPRGWSIGDPNIDITTEEGLTLFHEKMMAFARHSVSVCTNLNAQGVIVWSLEGQQFPHTISYVGSPDKLGENAPEMDAIADEWFKVFSDAGLRTGVCLRPHKLWTPPDAPNWRIQCCLWKDKENRIPDNDAIVDLLDAKIAYAKKRWGCTLYYVDSNTYNWPKFLDWTIFSELGKRHPDCLIIPEHETLHYWRVSAPLAITPGYVRAIWPEAFSVPLMQHVSKCDDGVIATYSRIARGGDALIIDGWYQSIRNRVVEGAYEKGFVKKWHIPETDRGQSEQVP